MNRKYLTNERETARVAAKEPQVLSTEATLPPFAGSSEFSKYAEFVDRLKPLLNIPVTEYKYWLTSSMIMSGPTAFLGVGFAWVELYGLKFEHSPKRVTEEEVRSWINGRAYFADSKAEADGVLITMRLPAVRDEYLKCGFGVVVEK